MLHYYTAFAEDDVLVTWMQKASRANAAELEEVILLIAAAESAPDILKRFLDFYEEKSEVMSKYTSAML